MAGEAVISAASMLPLFCVSMALKRFAAAARYSSSEILPSPFVSIFCNMCWKNDGREVGAVVCAIAHNDPPTSGSAVRIASISLRDMGFLGGMADRHVHDNAATSALLTMWR